MKKIIDPTEVSQRIIDIQTAYVTLQEKHHQILHNNEHKMDTLLLGIIDVLDFLEHFESPEKSLYSAPEGQKIIKKTTRRLKNLLSQFNVSKIQIHNNIFLPGEVRILESTQSKPSDQSKMLNISNAQEENSNKNNFEICRNGYMRNKRVLRPVDIVTF